jgi:arylsulfatase A-like enzyme
MTSALPGATVAAVLLAAVACGAPPAEPPPPPPNIVLVVLDTVRADALSCYGNPRQTTPRIDALARAGTRYTAAYATSFWTLPSHGSLLTGLYPSAAGSTSESNHLPAAATTLAERLGAAGWATGAVVRNAWLSSERGFDQGFAHWVEAWRADADAPSVAGEEAAVAAALRWIEDGRDHGAPFFLFVNLNVAHLPYDPPAEVRGPWLETPVDEERLRQLMGITGGWGHLAGALELSAADLEALRDLYHAEVSVADRLVGTLVDGLARLGQLERCAVIVTADHGENLGDHGMIDHVYSMYDTTVRVPLVIRYPERFAAGAVADGLVSLVDLAPTILDLAGARRPDVGWPGRSLADPGSAPHQHVFAENGRPVNGVRLLARHFPAFDAATIDHPMRMVREGAHKLVWRVGVAAELYDLAADPGETRDLAPIRRDLRDLLLADLRHWARGLEALPRHPEHRSSDRESLEQLRALGYLE